MGTSSKIIFNCNITCPMQNGNNERVNIQEQIEMMLQKAEELATKKERFSREVFAKDNKVHIQDPTSKLWTEEGEVIQGQKYNRELRSFLVKGSDWGKYLINGHYLFLQA